MQTLSQSHEKALEDQKLHHQLVLQNKENILQSQGKSHNLTIGDQSSHHEKVLKNTITTKDKEI